MKCIFEGVMRLTYLTSRNKKAVEKEIRVSENFAHLKSYQQDLKKQWVYKNDKWLGLRNHISPPPRAVLSNTGDCDDYASHLYQAGQRFNPFLLTYFPRKLTNAHTVMVLKPEQGEWKGYYILMNWSKLDFFTTKEQMYRHLEGYARGKIISFHWAEYDYPNGTYRGLKEKKM